MEGEQKKATLKDILNYDTETYLSQSEVDLIKRTFKNNPELIKVLRKILLPTAFDPELPIEEMQSDAWMVDKDFALMPAEDIKPIVLARQDMIKFILGGLIKLKMIANIKEETKEEKDARQRMDSLK